MGNDFTINYSWVYMIGHWWICGNWASHPLPKRKFGPLTTDGLQEIWHFSSSWLQDTKTIFSPNKKKYLWVGGGAYTMENETEIQTTRKLLGRGPKLRNYRNYNLNHFFIWDLYSLFFIRGIFKSHPKKVTPT